MKRHLRKIFAATLLAAALSPTPATTEARGGRARQGSGDQTQAPRPAALGQSGSQVGAAAGSGTTGRRVTVVRRVSRATAPASIIEKLRSEKLARAMVTVRGRTVSPRRGNSIFLLSNGGYLVLGTDRPDVVANAVEGDIFLTPEGRWIFKGCLCPGRDGDDCRIDSASNRTCYSTSPDESCCSWAEIEIGGSDPSAGGGSRR